MRTIEGETVLTLKEASKKFDVPVTWLRSQLGKLVLPDDKALRLVKFPADKNYYLFLSEVEKIAMPRVFSSEFIEKTQLDYDQNPEGEPGEDE